MTGKSETSPAHAFQIYVEMGEKRSIIGLEKKLQAMGSTAARTTLMRWAKKYDWKKKIDATDKLAVQSKKAAIQAHEIAEAIKVQVNPIPFTVVETFEGTANAMHSMTSTMSKVVQAAMEQYLARGDAVSIDLDELLSIARVTVDLGKTVADMHRALQGVAVEKPTPQRDPLTGLLEGAPIPGAPPAAVMSGLDEILAIAQNPPRTR